MTITNIVSRPSSGSTTPSSGSEASVPPSRNASNLDEILPFSESEASTPPSRNASNLDEILPSSESEASAPPSAPASAPLPRNISTVALTEVAAKLLRTIPSAIAKEVAEGPKSEPLPKRKSEVKSELKVLELATLKVVDPDKVQVLVAEDHPMFKRLVQNIADQTTTWCEIDFADSGHLAVEAARVKGYHIIFMDNQMPKKTAEVIEGGAAAAKEIRTFKPDVPIVVQSNDPDRKALVENFPENVQHIIKGKLTNLAQFEYALRYNQLFIGPLLNKQQ